MPKSPEQRINSQTEGEGKKNQEVLERRQELINEMLKLPTARDLIKQWDGLSREEENLLWAVYSSLYDGDRAIIYFDENRKVIEEKFDKMSSLYKQLEEMGIIMYHKIDRTDTGVYTIYITARKKAE